MREFYQEQLDYIFFLYSLVLLILAVICFLMRKEEKQTLPWEWLGMFGITASLVQWLDLLAISITDRPWFYLLRACLSIFAFSFLTEFGRAGLVNLRGKGPGRWIFGPLLGLTLLGALVGNTGLKAATHYVLCFWGGLGAAIMLYLAAKSPKVKVGNWLIPLSISLAIYAITEGVIVNEAAFFPANLLNDVNFFRLLGFPIQLLQTICALAMSVTVAVWFAKSAYLPANVEEDEVFLYRLRPKYTLRTALTITAIVPIGWFITDIAGHYSGHVVASYRLTIIFAIQALCIATIFLFITWYSNNESAVHTTALQFAAVRLSNQKRLRNIAATLGEGVYVSDEQGKVAFMNPAAERLLGWSEEELLGRSMHETIHYRQDGNLVNPEDCLVVNTVLMGGTCSGDDSFFVRKDGMTFPVSYISTPLIEHDVIVGSVTAFQDITERKQAQEAMQAQQVRLQEQQLQLQLQLRYASSLYSLAEIIAVNEDTKAILTSMIDIVAETLAIDHAIIYEVNLEQGSANKLYSWVRTDTSENTWNQDGIEFKNFPESVKYLQKNKDFLQSHYDEINPIFLQEGSAEFCHQRRNIKSLLWYPFKATPGQIYLLAFNTVTTRRTWLPNELEFIKTVANQVATAIQKVQLLEERRQAEQEIWEEKERAQVTLHSIGDAVITTDPEGKIVFLNPVAEQLTGWTNAEAQGLFLTVVFNIIDETTGISADNPVEKCIAAGCVVGLSNHTVLLNRDGCRYAIEDSAAPIKNRQGELIGAVLVFHDVSEKRNLLQQMIHQAHHDPLTERPNRILFNDRLNIALANARRSKENLAVMFLDLDRFKLVNDMLGHAMGDRLLKEVASRLSTCMRETDTIARLGGDEFTLLLPHITRQEDIDVIANKILQVFQKPWVIDGYEFHITASIGIALYPDDGEDTATLMKHADTAMYRAKEKGRNNFQFFTKSMNEKIIERMTLENSLHYALEREEFTLYYQPQVNIDSGRTIGMEALIRWNHPQRGLVLPTEFIPLTEETGLIIPIGEWVLHTACNQNKIWQQQGYPPIRVKVNLSAYQFRQSNLVETVTKVLQETHLDPYWLELEITESVAVQDIDFTIRVLYELRAMGIRVAIDDFGTGYSSLNYLKRFPINTLKIDRSFVRDIVNNQADAAIVSSMIVLAQNLGLNVIAEGVETLDQLNFLRERNCLEMQGYYFSKPVPATQFELLLTRELPIMG